MPLTPLAPAPRPGSSGRRWSFAASTILHLIAIALVVGIASRQPPPQGAGSPSYDLIFEAPTATDQAKPPGLPPMQPADVPVPDDAPVGDPAPAPASPPQPDGLATPLPEATAAARPNPAQTAPPPPSQATAPAQAAATPAPSAAQLPPLAFAPPTPAPTPPSSPPDPATPSEPTQAEIRPETAPPTVNLRQPSDAAEQPDAAFNPTPIMPQAPQPLPQAPQRPRPQPRPPSRQALGTLSNPMELSFAPRAPRPAARGAVASRAFDLSPPPEREGASRSDPYAQIRAASASEDWNRGLLQYWLRHRFYPPQAAENGDQGTVTIQLTVERSGRVADVEVLSRSGSQWLDLAAVSTWRNAQLPPFTNEMRQDRITFPIPITYYLIRR